MIKAYVLEKKALKELSSEELKSRIADAIWVDLAHPTVEEEALIEDLIGVDVPTRAEMHEIELSSRLYQRNSSYFTTISIVTYIDSPQPESHVVTFVLHNKSLITVRYIEGAPYDTFLEKTKINKTHPQKPSSILSAMLEEISEKLADLVENVTHNIEGISHQIFKYDYTSHGASKESKPNFKDIISHIGRNEDLLSKARESLFTITRMLSFILQTPFFEAPEDKKPILMIMKDIPPLIEHVTFLSNKINFLLDATLGMINIEQSSIIKIVSVAAVVFLPPTLVASIYGMNFEFMPELKWEFGYPISLILMLLAGFFPYRYFKYKEWL